MTNLISASEWDVGYVGFFLTFIYRNVVERAVVILCKMGIFFRNFKLKI